MPEERNYTMSPKERIENFWYHYKWHTVMVLFFVLVISVCTVQFCRRESYDVYVMYAGGGEINRKSEGGDVPEYQKAVSSLLKYADDFNGDGTLTLSLLPLFVPSDADIAAIKAKGGEINYSLVYDNSGVLSDNMLYSDYYLCFLSEDLFLKYCAEDTEVFDKIAPYTADGRSYDYVGEYGIRLSSLAVYQRDGIKGLPDDTVVCIRKLGAVSTRFDKDTEQAHERAGLLLKELLK